MRIINIQLQRSLAKNAGMAPTGESWESQYDYHLSVIDPPLTFGAFKTKFCLLDSLYDPNKPWSALEDRLSNELGY